MDAGGVPRVRPARGAGHYLRDLVYGANDGVVTTLAIIAGVTGADLSVRVAIILGLANLVADGVSMGASNYLAIKSELEQTGGSVAREAPWRHGLATFAAFAAAGAVPLAAFVLPVGGATFGAALVLSLVTLAFVGAARAPFTRKGRVWCALEVVLVGGVAAAAAYGVGVAAQRLV